MIVTASSAVCGCWVTASAAQQPAPDVGTLLTRVGQRVVDYYHRAQSLICVEKSMVQPIDSTWSSQGLSRSVESELRVESEAADGEQLPEAKIVRAIRRINGRAPRDSDKTDRNACTDPNPLSPEPLAFLLASHRDQYKFTAVHADRIYVVEDGRAKWCAADARSQESCGPGRDAPWPRVPAARIPNRAQPSPHRAG